MISMGRLFDHRSLFQEELFTFDICLKLFLTVWL